MKRGFFYKACECALALIMCLTLTACGKQDDDDKKTEYKNVTAEDICTAVTESQTGFAGGAIETFNLYEPENRDTYFELCYDVEDFSGSGLVSDFMFIGCSQANADEVAAAVVPKASDRSKVKEMFRFRMESRIDAFTGYAPEQAAKLKKGKILMYDRYVIFLVCEDVDSAVEAIEYLLKKGRKMERNTDPTGTVTPTPTSEPDPTGEPSPSPEPTGVEPTGPIIVPTIEPTGEPDPSEYYRGKYESGFNPVLPEAIRTGRRDMLTDPQDLQLYDRCREILTELFAGKSMTMIEAEKEIYAYVVLHVDYDYGHYSLEGQKVNSDNPYGALFTGEGICTGYSTLFRLLCNSIGIECIDVAGTAYYQREEHGWNMVKLGPCWYYVDPCWGDYGDGRVSWTYFNVNEEKMTKTEHYWDKEGLPEADTMNYDARKNRGNYNDLNLPADTTYVSPESPKVWFVQ